MISPFNSQPENAMMISRKEISNVEVLVEENDYLSFDIVPSAGGKIISVYNKKPDKEFLWRHTNLHLATHKPGADHYTTIS